MENLQTGLKATGDVEMLLTDEFGNVKEKREIKNLVVTVGRNFIADRMIGTASAVMSHMGIGTGTVAPAAANTSLGSPIGTRSAFSVSPTRSNATVSYTAIFAPGNGTGAITEAGIFNDPTAGTMLCRTVFNVVNKGAADTLTINWSVTINAS